MTQTIYQQFSDMYNYRRTNKEYGVEIEMAGRNLPLRAPGGWRATGDGSLRGPEGIEYVLDGPVDKEELNGKLTDLWKHFKKNGSELQPNNSCSVHVHMNVQDMTLDRVVTLIMLYLIAENALVRWCGEGREGNLFCLRARDAEYLIDCLEDMANNRHIEEVNTDNLRYAALNVRALCVYGSLEFRAMRGVDDFPLVEKWVDILDTLKKASEMFPSPADVILGFSEGGEHVFVDNVFGEYAKELFNYDGWDKDIYEGMRRCQCIAFSYRTQAQLDVENQRLRDEREELRGQAMNVRLDGPIAPEEDEGPVVDDRADAPRGAQQALDELRGGFGEGGVFFNGGLIQEMRQRRAALERQVQWEGRGIQRILADGGDDF